MQVKYSKRYTKQLQKLKKQKELLTDIKTTLFIFNEDITHSSLHFKKITCKKDKNRYSIRVQHSKYRILMTVFDEYAELFCICDHDDYDFYNKNC